MHYKIDNMIQRFCYLLLFITCFTQVNAQQTTCCQAAPVDGFNNFAMDPAFQRKHEAPVPFLYTGQEGQMIQYDCNDGQKANAFWVPSELPTNWYLVVIHEWWGLNDYVKQEAARLSRSLGINVLALDLYDGKVASQPADAAKYMKAVQQDRAIHIVQGAMKYMPAQSRFFTIGWCFGGGWSLQAAIQGGGRAAGAIMFYGMPETKQEKLQLLQCDVLGIFASKDEWITPEVYNKFEADMKQAGKHLDLYAFDADHAFANPSNPKYNEQAAEAAYEKVASFIKQRIK